MKRAVKDFRWASQVGTVMRNEISPRQGPIRLREFTIMEMELFFDPNEVKCPYLDQVKGTLLPILLAKEREQKGSQYTHVTPQESVSKGMVLTEWMAYFMALSVEFVKSLGIAAEEQRFEEKMVAERSHYSSQTFDHQIRLDRWGWVEIAGHAYRTDFDLTAHMKSSGADLSIFKPYDKPISKSVKSIVPIDSVLGPLLREKSKAVIDALKSSNPDEVSKAFEKFGFFVVQGFKILPTHVRVEERTEREAGRRVVPYVVEPSFGAERLVYSTLEHAYTRSKDRVVLKLPKNLVPIQIMVFPLMAKDGLPELASEIQRLLSKNGFEVEYDESGTIGRRYARADEVGVPLSITVDYKSKDDKTVTIRDRDTWAQVRGDWEKLPEAVLRFFQGETEFEALGMPVESNYE